MDDHLSWLYPSSSGDNPASDTDLASSIRDKIEESRSVKQTLVDQADALIAMGRALAEVFRNGGRLLTMGNGGSASDAAHVAVEFNHPVTVGRRALPAIHLGADLQMLTAVGNDVGFREVFARQVISMGREGDALIGLSTSGNSDNLLSAFTVAKERGLVTLGLSGNDGGRMVSSGLVDHSLVVPSDRIHRIQESHVLAYHILWDLVHTVLGAGTEP